MVAAHAAVARVLIIALGTAKVAGKNLGELEDLVEPFDKAPAEPSCSI
jgi:hypothetical protein